MYQVYIISLNVIQDLLVDRIKYSMKFYINETDYLCVKGFIKIQCFN